MIRDGVMQIRLAACAAVITPPLGWPGSAQQPANPEGGAHPLDDLVAAVVRIKTFINADGRTIENLGREREGSGILIDNDGLVLTIGYLMVEAHAAQVVTNAGRTVPATVVGTITRPASASCGRW